MIDWFELVGDSFWIGGISLLLIQLSYALLRRAETGIALRALLLQPGFRLAGSLALLSVCIGLAANSRRGPWEGGFWLALAALFAVEVWRSDRQRRGLLRQVRPLLRQWLQGQAPAALALIVLGVLLAALYAATVRPWMQPDEPRHFHVALHVARLRQPVVWYNDRVPAWEREIIAEMEAHDFWWYGYSLIGWDPEHLPTSFNQIWGVAYGLAFFQQPLYYTFAGLWLQTWAADVSLSQAVVYLRFFNVLLLAFSLFGVYKIAKLLFPARPQLTLAILAFAALWPSHLAANAGVNNDALVELTVIWALFFAVRLVRDGPRLANVVWLLAFGLLSFYTKRSGLNAFVLFPLALLLWGSGRWAGRWTRRRLLIGGGLAGAALVSALALALIALRSQRLLLPAGFAADVWSGQYWQEVSSAPLGLFASALLRTFIGWFGWLRTPLPTPFYWAGGALLLAAACGFLIELRRPRRAALAGWQKRVLWLLVAALAIQIGFVVGKEIVYASWRDGSLPQARYLYPVLPALAIPLLMGWGRLAPARWHSLSLLIIGLLIFNIYVLAFILYPFFWL